MKMTGEGIYKAYELVGRIFLYALYLIPASTLGPPFLLSAAIFKLFERLSAPDWTRSKLFLQSVFFVLAVCWNLNLLLFIFRDQEVREFFGLS